MLMNNSTDNSKVAFGSAVMILNDSFEEMQLLGQIADSNKLHSGPKAVI